MTSMNRQRLINALKEPNGAEKLAQKAEQVIEPAWELFAMEHNAAACALLVRLAKQKKFAAWMDEKLESDSGILENALCAKESKLRKNTARLMGELKKEAYVEPLVAAMEKEDTRFVKPSIILALGAIGGERAKAYLENYKIAPAKDESEKRHYNEETDALNSAMKKLTVLQRHEFTGLKRKYDVELRCADKLEGSLLYDMEEAGIEPKEHKNNRVFLTSDDIEGLYALRSMGALLLPVLKAADLTDSAQVLACRRFIKELFEESFSGEPPFGYRIEIKGEDVDRAAVAKSMAAIIDSKDIVNSPGSYDVELIVDMLKNNRADVYARLTTIKDERFSYRAEALPASIHPATAAAVLRYAMDHLKVNARVLDPCCGSGTMLFEREKLSPAKSLTGVDIAHKAIDIARRNGEKGNSTAKFVCNDMLRFEVKRPYDELIANLPFGNRVGSHQANEKLYAGLLDRLPKWLVEDGVAVLYTMEFTLLKRLIKERPYLKLVTETRTEAGGLMPGIFIIKLQRQSVQ